MTYLEATHPLLASPPSFLPAGYSMVRKFPSSAAVDDYVQSSSYPSSQQISMALIISSTSGSYTLRPNSTFFADQSDRVRPNVHTMPNTDTLFNSYASNPSAGCEPDKQGGPVISNVCSTQVRGHGLQWRAQNRANVKLLLSLVVLGQRRADIAEVRNY